MTFSTGIVYSKASDASLSEAVSTPYFRSDEEAVAFIEHRGFQPVGIGDELGPDFGGTITNSGAYVGPEAALRVAAAYACRRVISEDIAKLPRRVVRDQRNFKGVSRAKVAWDHPVHELLNHAPNDWMTPFEFVEFMVGVATFHHGAYAFLNRDASGHLTEILPLLPGTCGPEYDHLWQVTYRANGYGESLVLEPHQIFRLNGPMQDPWQGNATVHLAREAIGLAAAIEAAQSRFHANDMRPSGILTTEQSVVTSEQRDAIKRSWESAYGQGQRGGVAVLDKAFKFEAMAVEGVKQEVIENRKFQIAEICRFFRVFPTAIGHNDGSQTFASVEAFFTAHAVHTLQPWVRRVEEAMTMCLLTEDERRSGYRVDLDMDANMRGTPSDRAKYYESATKVFMTPNEARVREGLDPHEDPEMDKVLIQRNNTATTPALEPSSSKPKPPDQRPQTPGQSAKPDYEKIADGL